MKNQVGRPLILTVIFALLLNAACLLHLFLDDPFLVARQAVVDAGEWSDQQVHFKSGTYWFLFVVCRVEAEVTISLPEGERLAEVQLLHLPFAGWSLKDFRVHEHPPAEDL